MSQYTIEDCPGFAPGMSLPQDECERCGGNRYADHPVGQRAAALHTVFRSGNRPVALSLDQIAQGLTVLPGELHPRAVEYPCGCKASGGNGIEALPSYCPTHEGAL